MLRNSQIQCQGVSERALALKHPKSIAVSGNIGLNFSACSSLPEGCMSFLHKVFERHCRSVQWHCVLEQHDKNALHV